MDKVKQMRRDLECLGCDLWGAMKASAAAKGVPLVTTSTRATVRPGKVRDGGIRRVRLSAAEREKAADAFIEVLYRTGRLKLSDE